MGSVYMLATPCGALLLSTFPLQTEHTQFDFEFPGAKSKKNSFLLVENAEQK